MMMCRAVWIVSVLWLMAFPALSKEPVEWKSATVLHAQYRLDSSAGVAGGGGSSVARGEFEFDAGDVVYTAAESVAPNLRMQLSQGDAVQLATDNKTLMLKMDGNRIRKLKLVSSLQKSKK